MNRKIYLLMLSALSPFMAQSQVAIDTGSMWTWVKGMSSSRDPGSLTPPETATPSARFGASRWTDKNGRLWLFGGEYFDGSTNSHHSDLWRFDPTTNNQWSLINGATNYGVAASYGGSTPPGTPSSTTTPGNRKWASAWMDKNGDFWLFGGTQRSGSTLTYRNDLWKYEHATNQWRWMKGSQDNAGNGTFGTKETAATTNTPGARGVLAGSATWVDKDGNLWLFGGQGHVAKHPSASGMLNDLWKYDIASSNWIWMHGSDSVEAAGVYGTKGNPAPGNTPGARKNPVYWTDAEGNFWLFGGYGKGKNVASAGYLNDLWKYDPATNRWTWINGPDETGAAGSAGTRGVAALTNLPIGREGSSGWTDNYGNLWLLGGITYASGTPTHYHDLWRYNIQSAMWTWMKGTMGTNAFGNYGTTPLPANAPGGRGFHQTWRDTSGNFWLFGGTGIGTSSFAFPLNDLWRLSAVQPTIPAQPAAFTSAKRYVCAGESNLPYTIPAVPDAVAYEWEYTMGTGISLSGGAITTTPVNNLSFSSVATSGVLKVRAVNAGGNYGPWRDTAIGVVPIPTAAVTPSGSPAFCQGDSVLLTATETGMNYEWFNGTTLVGTNRTYYAKTPGNYTVKVTATSAACSATSVVKNVIQNSLPALSVSPSGSASVCDGDSVLLSATASGVSYEWKNGTSIVGTASTYYAKTAGSYTVTATATSNGCKATSVPVAVTVNPLPAATVNAGGGLSFCVGGSVTLTAGPGTGYTYQWLNGTTLVGTGNLYIAGASGDYRVVATSMGCKDTSMPVSVIAYNKPSVSLEPGDTAFCAGGKVTLYVATQDTGLTYRWKNGTADVPLAIAHFLDVEESGVYSVVVERATVANCTDSTNEVAVTVHPLPVADVTWDGTILQTSPGYPHYQWYNGTQPVAGATNASYRPLADGNYSVTIEDDNGCTNTSAAQQLINVSVDDVYDPSGQVSIYPNPVRDLVHIQAPAPVSAILSGMDGRMLQIAQGEGAHIIDMKGYKPGIYLLRITNQAGLLLKVEKLIKE